MKLKTLVPVVLILLALAAWLVPTRLAFAQKPTPSDDQVNSIAHQLYCPVCENTPLDVCPTEACRQWRDLIRQQLSEGWTADQIKQYFVQQYGARVLDQPPAAGLNVLFYVVPGLIIVGGAVLLLRAMRTWSRTSPAAPAKPDQPAPADEYVARLEEELKNRK